MSLDVSDRFRNASTTLRRLGAVSCHQGGGEAAHTAGFAGIDSDIRAHQRRQSARRERSRSAHARARRLLRAGGDHPQAARLEALSAFDAANRERHTVREITAVSVAYRYGAAGNITHPPRPTDFVLNPVGRYCTQS